MRDAKAGRFDKVCVTYMSRLARGEAYHIAEYLLSEHGVQIELVREKFTAGSGRAVKVLPQPEDLTAEYKRIERRLIGTDKRIARCQEAIEVSSGSLRSLIERLEALEADRLQVEAKKNALEEQGTNLKRKRPDANEACALWGRFSKLWNKATDEERTV